jgi:hypothetical protein
LSGSTACAEGESTAAAVDSAPSPRLHERVSVSQSLQRSSGGRDLVASENSVGVKADPAATAAMILLVGPAASDSRQGGILGGLRLSRRAIRRRGRARRGGRRGRGRWRQLPPLGRRGRSGGLRRGHRYWSRGARLRLRLLDRGDVRRGLPRPRLSPQARKSGSATERKAEGGRGRGPGGPRVPRLLIVQRRATSCEANPEEDGTRGGNRESPTKRHG